MKISIEFRFQRHAFGLFAGYAEGRLGFIVGPLAISLRARRVTRYD